MKEKLGTQRVFQHADGRYILLTKAGRAVSFWIDELKKEGWKCIGPGIEFDRLLEEEKQKRSK
ncbi:MAG: hypothetical protein JRI70_10600 [Deltaproteobacteria bacterium]|nr:hypothetical protein [Deltaproteobacteria bacterium]